MTDTLNERIEAEFSMDPQHGPIVSVTIGARRVSIYLMQETGVVTEPNCSRYGIEVKGPWWKFRQLVEAPMLGDGAQWGSHGPAVSTLPDCMMPDGDSPCHGYLDLREKAERMATALHRIGEVTLVPGNWGVTDWPSLNGMVSAVRQMHEAEVRLASVLESLNAIAGEMDKLAASRSDDWDVKGYALALRGTLMAVKGDDGPGESDE